MVCETSRFRIVKQTVYGYTQPNQLGVAVKTDDINQAESLFDRVKRHLAETRGRWPEVAEGSGVPISTLRKIAQGRISDPAVGKVQAIADYFQRKECNDRRCKQLRDRRAA